VDTPLTEDVLLGGRYRLHSLLGSGGMAQVYDGWDERLARPVAVKLLRPDLAAVPDLRRRFELEARAAARLTHPNVVAVYDAGEDGGRSYIVMERLPGESLADTIRNGPVDVAWLHRLAAEVLAALGAAHAAGVVHRDIKPGNILLGPHGQAKVADFGIARVVEPDTAGETATALTGVGLVVGTPAYLAPERAMGHPATTQSDLYSLGVVLYEALTGTKPYAGSTPAAIAAATVQGVAQNPSVLRPDADPALVAVIGRAMAVNPAYRYSSAAEMAADLRRSAPPATAVMAAAAPMLAAAAAPALAPTAATVPMAPAPPLGPGPHFGGRRGLVILGAALLVLALFAVVLANAGGSPSRAATPPATASPASTTPSTRPTTVASTAAPTPTTAPTVVAAGPLDPVATALQAIANQLTRSESAAAGSLASGLSTVAAMSDSAARAAAASSLLNQAVRWYQDGQLTAGEYAAAAAVLHLAGAPAAPPPTVKHGSGKSGGGGGGGG
jgi:hypothetical protein